MGKPEIESWIASTSTVPDENLADGSGLPEWRRDLVLKDWLRTLEVAQSRLLTSSTKVRIQFLRDEMLVLVRHGGESEQYVTILNVS